MKRVVMIFLLFIFICISNMLYAANGDFTVTGKIGAGTTTPKATLDVKDRAIIPYLVESTGFVDLAKGKTPTITGGALSSGGPCFRGDGSKWKPESFPATMTIDLGTTTYGFYIQYITFGTSWKDDSRHPPYGFTIEHSADGTTWTTLVSETANTKKDLIYPVDVTTTRYIRMTVNASQPGQTETYVAGFQVLSKINAALSRKEPWAVNGDNAFIALTGNVGIGTSAPAASAALDVTSSSKGFLPPRMTSTQRDAIASPVAGLLIYNTTDNAYNFYTGTSWMTLGTQGTYSNSSGYQVFNASGTFTVPANITKLHIRLWGGGGGGGGSAVDSGEMGTNYYFGGGGGAGGYAEGILTVSPGQTLNVTVGSGGAGGGSGGGNGSAGGTTTMAGITANGGGGGVGGGGYSSSGSGGSGGTATGAALNVTGASGQRGSGGGMGGAALLGAGGTGGVIDGSTNYYGNAGSAGKAGAVTISW